MLHMSVTLQDIADELEISAATVSRALQQDRLISPATRARVNETAQRLGYQTRLRRPRRVTESRAKTDTVGLLLRSDSVAAAQSDSNLMKMMAGIMAATDDNRVLLQVHTIRHEEKRLMVDEPTVVPLMVQEGVCQAVIAHGEQDEGNLAYLANRMPVISMGRVYRSLPIDAVVADNLEGARGVVRYLYELGHRRMAWVGAHYAATFLEARQAGFLQGCLGLGLEIGPQQLIDKEVFDGQNIGRGQVLLDAAKTGVSCFVCGNDATALKVIDLLEANGFRVPEQISVTGFDAWPAPRNLTSVDPHFYEIGKAAALLALQRISQPALQPCTISVRCKLVPGQTTAPAAR
jgi:LacI family transcriptional regulator